MSTSLSSKSKATLKSFPIDKIIPYWRNPRKISEEAIEKVMESITEFGYVQPIVVDTEQVIIIGHTRYQALRRLGYTDIDVLEAELSASEAKELRIVDNKTHEFSKWDFEKLDAELTELADDTFTVLFFPEASSADFDFEVDSMDLDGTPSEPESHLVEFVCPSCWHEWDTHVTREQVLSGTIESEEA